MAEIPLTESDEVTIADAAGVNKLTVLADGSASINLTDVAGTAITLGQKVMASSIPVVSASDQLYASGNGTISSYPQGITISTLGRGDVKIHVTGTFSGTIVPYMTVNGSQLGIIPVLNLSTGAYVSSITSTGMFIIPAANAYSIQLWSSSWASGTATIYWVTGSGVSEIDVRTWLGSQAPTVGQKTMAASIPVVIPSDQPILPPSGIVVGTVYDSAGNALTVKSAAATYNPPTAGNQATPLVSAVVGKRIAVLAYNVQLGVSSANTYLRDGTAGVQLSVLFLRATGGSVPTSYIETGATGIILFATTAGNALVTNCATNTGTVSVQVTYVEL
jgi:hypothetical protein